MSMSETIRIVMVKRNMTGIDLKQLRKIGDKLNCDLHIGYELRDTHEKF